MRYLCAFLGVLAICATAHGQITVYQETFPYLGPTGDQPISSAGWANDIPGAPGTRLFNQASPDGAVFAFEGGPFPVTSAYYTTTALDSGAPGQAFPSINPASFTGLTLNVEITAGFDADNIAARFAVRMGGSSWFASTTVLPVPQSQTGGFTNYSLAFSPSAAGWSALTLNGTSATIGGAAGANHSGNITGAGLVFTHSIDSGTHDFDTFRITAAGTLDFRANVRGPGYRGLAPAEVTAVS